IALRREHNREDMLDEVRVKLEQCHRQSEGRLGAVRVTLTGACEAHRALGSPAAMEEAAAEIRNLANDFDGEIWIEKIRFDTSAPVDLDRLRRGTDLMGDLLRLFDDLMEDEDELRHLAGDLRRLQERNPAEFANAGIDMEDP